MDLPHFENKRLIYTVKSVNCYNFVTNKICQRFYVRVNSHNCFSKGETLFHLLHDVEISRKKEKRIRNSENKSLHSFFFLMRLSGLLYCLVIVTWSSLTKFKLANNFPFESIAVQKSDCTKTIYICRNSNGNEAVEFFLEI